MSLGLRKILVLVLSVIGGIAGVYVMFYFINVFWKANVDFDRYGATYFVLTAIPIGLLVGLWMDFFLRAGIIPEHEEPGAAATGAAEE
jgi:uncharacterized membrane-anchored protein